MKILAQNELHRILKEYPDYLIYKDGKVYSLRRNKFLNFSFYKGYPRVRLYKHNRSLNKEKVQGYRKSMYIHRLLMMTFKPIKNAELYEVNHIDGDRSNYNLDNLEWCTSSENQIHKYRVLKREPSGYDPEKTLQIIKLREDGLSLKEIGLKFNLAKSTICYHINKSLLARRIFTETTKQSKIEECQTFKLT